MPHATAPAPGRALRLGAALVLVALATAMSALPVGAAAATIRFGVNIGSVGSCLTIWSTPHRTAHFVWRDADGAVKADTTNFTDNGLWYFCPQGFAVEIGDRLKVADGSASRTFVVPNLTINLDRVSDTYYGTGPVHRTVRIEVVHGDYGQDKSARVGDDGTWRLHTNQWDIYGGDFASLSWTSVHGDRVRTGGIASFVIVTLGQASFSGWAVPGQDVDIALADGVDAFGSATASPRGEFAGSFRDSHGHLRPVAPGDHLTAPSLASDADWIVPAIDGSANAANDIVQGQCHDSGTYGWITVLLYRRGNLRGLVYPGNQGDGSFRFNFRKVGNFFANPANVKHRDRIVVQCSQITGDMTQLVFRVP